MNTIAVIGVSAPMQRVSRLIHQVSANGYSVLICGERGSGRQLTAQTIHSLSPRKENPFIALDCSTLAPTLLKAELFGYSRGAFLGASEAKWGLLGLAGKGTIFLDQIAHLPSGLQAELLRVLLQKKFTPMGSTYPMPFKARLIAGTSSDLVSLVKDGAFGEEFYVAISVRQIQLPPLRERKADIWILADYFMKKYRASPQAEITCSDSARKFLEAYDWPGNVRELENTIQRALGKMEGNILRMRDVRLALRDESIVKLVTPSEALPPDEIERQAIVRALRESGGDTKIAAHRLGLGRAALSKRLRYHGLSGASL